MANADLSKLRIDKAAPAYRLASRWRPLAGALAVAVLLALGLLFFRGTLSPAVQVETATVSQVYPSQAFTLLNASGYVVAQRKAAVASKTTGRLEWLGVEEGSRVKQGEVLARLESLDAVALRDQAAANLNTARHTLEQAKGELLDAGRSFARQKELISQGIVAQAEYDVAEARFTKGKAAAEGAESAIKAAAAVLRGAEIALDYTLIRAPFDAVVLTKNADVGDIITPLGAAANAKAAVVSIADMGSLEVEADVSEANLEKIRIGQPCEITLDAFPDSRFRGELHTIVPTADRSKATVMVKIRFLDKDRRILPEMSAKVSFLERPVTVGERQPKTAVNPAVVVTRDGHQSLFLIKGDQVTEVHVTLGSRIGEMIEVKSGVKSGEKIAAKPLEKLKNGSRVKTAEK